MLRLALAWDGATVTTKETQQQLFNDDLQKYSIHKLDHISTIKRYPFHHIDNMTLSSTTDIINELRIGFNNLNHNHLRSHQEMQKYYSHFGKVDELKLKKLLFYHAYLL